MSKSKLYISAPSKFGRMDFFIVLGLGLVLLTIQSSFTIWAGFAGYGPEWVLPLAVFVTLKAELWVAVLAAFILGFFRDSIGGGFIGLYQFNLVLLIWLFYPFHSRFNFFNPLALIILTIVLCLGANIFILTPIMAALGWPSNNFNPLPAFFFSSLSTALIAPVLFYILDWLTREREEQHG